MDLQPILAVSPAIRYVATNLGGQVSMMSRPNITNASSSELDRYGRQHQEFRVAPRHWHRE
jgi:hypothetical protein